MYMYNIFTYRYIYSIYIYKPPWLRLLPRQLYLSTNTHGWWDVRVCSCGNLPLKKSPWKYIIILGIYIYISHHLIIKGQGSRMRKPMFLPWCLVKALSAGWVCGGIRDRMCYIKISYICHVVRSYIYRRERAWFFFFPLGPARMVS